MALPERDPEQRERARRKAVEARRLRADVKEMLKAGEVSLDDILDRADTVDALAKMRVRDVIAAMPNYGKVKADRVMRRIEIADSRRLRGLGHNQRAALLEEFSD